MRHWLLLATAGVLLVALRKKDALQVMAFGACLIAISTTAIVFGNIVAGPSGFRGMLSRETDSKSFWGFTVLYFLIGISAAIIGLLQATGLILK